jgi:hypothetical protein
VTGRPDQSRDRLQFRPGMPGAVDENVGGHVENPQEDRD